MLYHLILRRLREEEQLPTGLGTICHLLNQHKGLTKIKLNNIWTKEVTNIGIQYLIFS